MTVPPHSLKKLTTKKEIQNILSQGQRIAKKLESSEVLLAPPLRLATPLERAAHAAAEKLKIQFPLGVDRDFYFRCFIVPAWCSAVVQWAKQTYSPIPLWLGDLGAHIVANERWKLEAALLKPESTNLVQEMEPGFWLKRFQEWRTAAEQSLNLYLRKQSYALRTETNNREAALLGFLDRHCDGLPPEIFSSELARICTPCAAKAFADAKRSKGKVQWTMPQFETWMIETWPIVTLYGWSYHDVWLVACDLFEFSTKIPLGKKARPTEDRCKALNLKLSIAGSARIGRQAGCEVPMQSLAKWVAPIGADKELWIEGQFIRQRTFAPI